MSPTLRSRWRPRGTQPPRACPRHRSARGHAVPESERAGLSQYVYVAPAAVLFFLVVVLPLRHSVYLSFVVGIVSSNGGWMRLANYRRLIATVNYRSAFEHALHTRRLRIPDSGHGRSCSHGSPVASKAARVNGIPHNPLPAASACPCCNRDLLAVDLQSQWPAEQLA